MSKIKKLRRKKKYRYDVNRKRMNKIRLPGIESATVMKAWNSFSSTQKNFKKMGLVFDINRDIKYINKCNVHEERAPIKKVKSSLVVQELEKDAEAISSKKNFRFSKEQADFLTYLIKKYGNDYKAMSKDKKNYLQHTWKQIRCKIKFFKSIPDHYNEYLKNI